MGIKVVGKIDWEDGDLGGNNDFMKLEEGPNEVRLISKPYQLYVCWTNDSSGAQRKVRAALENCPLAERGEKIQAHWYTAIINRKTGKPAILEMGSQIFKQIVSLRKNTKWGDPRFYDINIERNPKGSQPLYNVQPQPKEPLTDAEKAMVKTFLDNVDLEKMTTPPTRAEVLKQLGIEEKVISKAAESASTSTDSGSDDSDDFNFDEV